MVPGVVIELMFTLTKSGLIMLNNRKAVSAPTKPRSALVITDFAVPAWEVFPALVIYLNPPMMIMNKAAIPTVQMPN